MGEILEGIKSKRSGKTITHESKARDVDDFEFYLTAIHEFSEAQSAQLANEDVRSQMLGNSDVNDISVLFPRRAELLESYQELALLIPHQKPSAYQPTQSELDELIEREELNRDVTNDLNQNIFTPDRPLSGTSTEPEGIAYQNEIGRIEGVLDEYIIRRGEELVLNGTEDDDFSSTGNVITKSQHVYTHFTYTAFIHSIQ